MKNTLTVGLLALLATTALGQAKLTGIETNKVGDGLQIVIKGEGLSNPRTLRVIGNTSYIVEFDAKMAGKIGREKIGYAGVQYVQYGWYKAKPPIVRVHVKSAGDISPVLTKINGNWIISIGCPTDNLTTTGTTVDTSLTTIPITKLQSQDEKAMQEAIAKLSSTPTVTAKADLTPVQTTTFDNAGGTVASLSTDIAPKITTEEPKRITPRIAPPANTTLQQKVSLDFVGTDIVQIMKALSIQAGVNIVTSPDVSPSDKPLKLTISMSNVELDQALSMVTSMASLRYARIGNTYVVAPNATFSQIMRQIMERNADSYQTRVVNLVSGDASKIREATLKAMPPDGRNGFYEIIVPGQNDATVAPANAGAVGGQAGGAGEANAQAGGGQPTDTQVPANAVSSNTSGKSRAYYLLIVGEPTRLNAVETFVHELDVRVAASFSLSRSQSTGTVAIPIQSGETLKIKTMIEKLLMENPRASDYSITETSVKELSQGEQSTKFLLMIGPDTELATLKSFAIALDKELCKPLGIDYLDDVTAMVKDYEVVNLHYLEPIVAAQDLKGRFKDLWVTVVPDNVTPGIKGEQDTTKAEAPTDTNTGGAGAPAAPAAQESKLKKETGREPMKLMLRGSKSTIADAKRYIALIDTAPKQIALEMRVMDLTKEDALNAGLDWSLGMGHAGKVNFLNSPGGGAGNFTLRPAGSLTITGALDSIANKHNLIARPNALVSDGREAHLFVGDTIRYVKQVQSTQNGVTVITDEVQVGSQFDIKARIGEGGAIALDLGQKFTILSSFLDIPGGGKLPQTSDRSSNLFVNMKSGETIAIGGLILESDIKNYSGVPFLKDLPVIGRLFGHTNNSHSRTEIVFFLTAVEVNDSNRADAASPQTSERNNPDPLGQYKKNGRSIDKNKLN